MKNSVGVNYWRNNFDRELTGLVNSIPVWLSFILTWGFYQVGSQLYFMGIGLMLLSIIFLIVTRIYNNATLSVTPEGFIIQRGKKSINIIWSDLISVDFERREREDEMFFPPIIMKIKYGKDKLELRVEKNLLITPMKKQRRILELINSYAPNPYELIKRNP